MISRIAVCAFVVCLGAVSMAADEKKEIKVNFTANAGVFSKYVWRGINTVDAPVLQWSAAAAAEGFSLTFWGNTDLTREAVGINSDTRFKTVEIDTVLDYTFTTSNLTLNAGIIDYQFPTTGFARTQEVYLGVAYPAEFSPKLTIYYDIKATHGVYAALSGGYTFADALTLGKDLKAPVVLAASIAYGTKDNNLYYFGSDKAALADFTFGASVPISTGSTWTITPSVNFSTLIDKGLKDSSGLPRSNVWFGLNFTVVF